MGSGCLEVQGSFIDVVDDLVSLGDRSRREFCSRNGQVELRAASAVTAVHVLPDPGRVMDGAVLVMVAKVGCVRVWSFMTPGRGHGTNLSCEGASGGRIAAFLFL